MGLEQAKDQMKIKVYRKSIPTFTEMEFGEKMDENKRDFFSKALNLHEDRFLISAARDYGKTWLQAVLALWSTTVLAPFYGRPYRVSILGGSREQSRQAYKIISDHIESSDFVERRVEGDPRKTETDFKDGSFIKALSCSQTSIRGNHPHLLCLDESAEVDRELVIAATESGEEYRTEEDTFPPRLVMTSTPHVYDSFFVENLREPAQWGFRIYTWKGIDSWNISERKVKDAKKRLSSDEFKREYLGEPSSTTALLLDKEDLRHAVIKEAPRLKNEGYITGGIDWGREHYTAIVIVQAQGEYNYVLECKMWKQKKFEWMKEQIMKLYDQYSIDMLYCDDSHQAMNERLRDEGAHLREIHFGTDKKNMISNLLFKFENGRVKIPHKFTELRKQLGIYHENRREKDDATDACMLALYAQKRRPRTFDTDTEESPISIGGKR